MRIKKIPEDERDGYIETYIKYSIGAILQSLSDKVYLGNKYLNNLNRVQENDDLAKKMIEKLKNTI